VLLKTSRSLERSLKPIHLTKAGNVMTTGRDWRIRHIDEYAGRKRNITVDELRNNVYGRNTLPCGYLISTGLSSMEPHQQTVGRYSAEDLSTKWREDIMEGYAQNSEGVLESVQEKEANQESNMEMHPAGSANLRHEHHHLRAAAIYAEGSCM